MRNRCCTNSPRLFEDLSYKHFSDRYLQLVDPRHQEHTARSPELAGPSQFVLVILDESSTAKDVGVGVGVGVAANTLGTKRSAESTTNKNVNRFMSLS